MWLIKIFVKIVLSRMPISNRIWRSFSLFKHGRMLDVNYAKKVFGYHFNHFRKLSDIPTILELGPGDSLFTGIFSYLNGCKSILIDANNFAETALDKYISQIDVTSVDIGILLNSTRDNWLSQIGCTYLTDGLKSIKLLPDESVDFIFSQAVLEHIFKDQYKSYVEEMYRILKRGGVASHRIDYKDHLASSLNNLRFSDSIWESNLFRNSGFYTNRLRASQTISIFERAGFVVTVIKTDKFDRLPINKVDLDVQFGDLDEADLIISGINILCFKP